jgi:cytochrome c oxidase cbb3-type subunit III
MRADSRERRTAVLLTLTVALLLSGACDPPGKPAAEEAQAIDREKILDFRELYESNCAGCHGTDGKSGAARTLNQPLYLTILPKDALRQIIHNGRPGTSMPAWAKSQGGPLTDQQVDALVDGIYQNWAKPENFKNATLLTYTAGAATGDVANGKRVFLKKCFACHAKGAAVGPVTEPSYLSLVSDQYLRSAILAGRPDFGMPDYRGFALTEQDVTDLSAYLESMRPPGAQKQMQDAVALQQQQQNAAAKTRGQEGAK